jgi:hypothetical protein
MPDRFDKNWFLTVLGTCNCEHPEPILVAGQFGSAIGQCPSCKRLWTIAVMGLVTRVSSNDGFELVERDGPRQPGDASDVARVLETHT